MDKFELNEKQLDVIRALENLGYKVYLQGERFVFDNANRIVDTNECLIAIKEN